MSGLSVCLSQVGILSKWKDGSSWVLACRLLSTYPALCCEEIQVSTKIMVLPSGTLSHTPDLEEILLCHISVVDLARDEVDAPSVINWTVVGQLS